MLQDVYAGLEEASRSGFAAVYLQRPCDTRELEVFNRRLRSELREDAEWYVRLLSVTNGLQIDNSIFESSHDFIETNLEHRAMETALRRYLIFGHNGNVDMYVYDKERAEQPFCIVGFFSAEDVYEVYSSIEGLLTALLDAESA